jgi:hypothetical protein
MFVVSYLALSVTIDSIRLNFRIEGAYESFFAGAFSSSKFFLFFFYSETASFFSTNNGIEVTKKGLLRYT